VGTAQGTTVELDGYRIHTALDTEQLTTIAQTTGGSYHPASDAAQLDGVAADIDLRLTVADQEVPLAGAFIGMALALLTTGALLTVVRTGRFV
jgi:Ca-activated chloride channel family protein